MMLILWNVYSVPYAAFSSSRMIEALWPLGVPKVSNSMREVDLSPVGRSEEGEDMVRVVIAVMSREGDWMRCLDI